MWCQVLLHRPNLEASCHKPAIEFSDHCEPGAFSPIKLKSDLIENFKFDETIGAGEGLWPDILTYEASLAFLFPPLRSELLFA